MRSRAEHSSGLGLFNGPGTFFAGAAITVGGPVQSAFGRVLGNLQLVGFAVLCGAGAFEA